MPNWLDCILQGCEKQCWFDERNYLVWTGVSRHLPRDHSHNAFCDDKKGAVAAGRSGRRTWHWMHVDDSVVAVIRDITNLHPIELDLQCEVLYLQKT